MNLASGPNKDKNESTLWILSEVYYPEETGTGYYITQIAEHLALNRRVSALCAQPSYSRAGVKAPSTEWHEGVHIFRCPSLILHQRYVWTRLTRMVSITLSILAAGIRRIRRGDEILAVTNPPSVPVLAAVLSFVLRVPYSLMVHDIYPDIIAACGLTSRDGIVFKTLQRINRIVLRHAREIICIGRDMSHHLALARGTGTSDGITVIPLWSECHDIGQSPKNDNPVLIKLGLTQKFVLLYAGNMGRPQGVETLAAAIKALEPHADIHFIFMGTGEKRRILDEMVARGSKNITLLPPRPRSDQNEFLNACDVGILALVPGMEGLAVPSRTFNLMAAGKPMIALVSERSEVARVIREEGIGWVVEPGAVEATIQAILEARRCREQLPEMGARARQAAETKYCPEVILSQFDVLLPPVLTGKISNETFEQQSECSVFESSSPVTRSTSDIPGASPEHIRGVSRLHDPGDKMPELGGAETIAESAASHPSLAVVILTYNEEANIAQALASATGWADQVFVLDSFSSDRTLEIARGFDCQIATNKFENYSRQRNYALDHLPIRCEWVFFLDADEWLPDALKQEISALTATSPLENGFYVKFRLIWMGKWISHGYYPTWILRLFRLGKARCEDRSVNEHLIVDGTTGRLRNDFMHEDRKGVSEWIAKHNGYSTREALELLNITVAPDHREINVRLFGTQAEFKRWLRYRVWNRLPPLVRPFFYFFYRFVLTGGFLDGRKAFAYHFLQALWFPMLIDIKYLEFLARGDRGVSR